MWKAKVVAVADVAADAAETNWKHKLTPNRGDLIIDSLFPRKMILWQQSDTAANHFDSSKPFSQWECSFHLKAVFS